MARVETEADSATPIPLLGLSMAGFLLIFALLLFLPAGRLNWVLGWVYLALLGVDILTTLVCLRRWNPELIKYRMRIGKGTKTWDIIWSVLFAPIMLAIHVVAAIEARDEISTFPGLFWMLGLAIFLPGMALLTWSMVVNPFFEKTVRIQTERGHRVIDTGPYAYVRHPGYVGFLAWILAIPLLLASAWAFFPALAAVVGLLIRTALEDRTLQAELPGYSEYASRVRFRLLPGLW